MSVQSVLTALADKIRSYTGKSDKMKLEVMPNEIEGVYEAGYEKGKSEDVFQYITYFGHKFRLAVFPENYEFVEEVIAATIWSTEFSNMFYEAQNLKSIKLIVKGNYDKALNVSSFIRNTSVEVFDLTEFIRKFTNVSWMFLGCNKLKSIYGALDLFECNSATLWLNGATALEDIEFVPNTINISIDFYWCTKLSKASITSAINGLSDHPSNLAVSFSKFAVNKAFETSEGANDGSTSAEWTTLIGTRSNWTFNLA